VHPIVIEVTINGMTLVKIEITYKGIILICIASKMVYSIMM